MSYYDPSEDLQIFFNDLTEEAQKRVLEFYKIESPEDMNWDVYPIMILPPPEDCK